MKPFYKLLISSKPYNYKQFYVLLLIILGITKFGYSQNYTVNTTTDGTSASGGTINLRGAILAADGLGGTHIITVPAGIYNLTLGEIIFGNNAQNITINGAGAASTIVNMTTTAKDRIFFINPPASNANVVTTISGITFQNGNLTSDTYGGGAICGGGPLNTMNIDNCVFTNNSTGTVPNLDYGGGAISFTYGGTLNITNSNFTSNSVPAVGTTGGGAISIMVFGANNIYPSSNIIISGCNFSNNSIAGTSNNGGALLISAQSNGAYPSTTLSVNVSKNNFVNNVASGTSGFGGAIALTNSFNTSNTFNVNFNRFNGNTSAGSTSASALYMTDCIGSVNATNNWWSCNSGANSCSQKAFRVTGSSAGILTTTPYLVLTATASPASICNTAPQNTSTLTASFLTNSTPASIAAGNLSALYSLPVSFNSGSSGSISGAQSTLQNTGTATATFTATSTSGNGGTATIDGVTSSSAVTVLASTLLNTTTTITQNTGVNNNVYQSGCAFLATVTPDGTASQVSGSVTAKVWVESTVPHAGNAPFLQRHYQITPAANPTTSTGVVTLYFLQSEFDAFNADPGANPKLPTGPNDAAGKANMKIGKYSGTSNNSSGLPGTFTSGAEVLTPTGVIWNSSLNRWEVTVNVNGFSGFIGQSSSVVLAIKLTAFTAQLKNQTVSLNWQIAAAENGDTYIVQRSMDGVNFTNINTQHSNSTQTLFDFDDVVNFNGNYYYRLQMIDFSGKITYSNVLLIKYGSKDQGIMIYPNPVKKGNSLTLSLQNITADKIEIMNVSGQCIFSQPGIITGSTQINMPESVPTGVYLVKIVTGTNFITQKIIVQ